MQWLKEHCACFNTKQIHFQPIISYLVVTVHLKAPYYLYLLQFKWHSCLDFTCKVQCIRARSIEVYICLAFTVHKYANSPPFIMRPHFSLHLVHRPLFPSPPTILCSPLITSITKSNIYLPAYACGCNFASPPSLSAYLSSLASYTKAGRHRERLTRFSPPLPVFSNLVLTSLPSTSCQDACKSGLPMETQLQS